MAKRGQPHVTWNERELLLQVKDLSIDMMDKLALEVITVSQSPVDTGYLTASAYVNSSSGLNTFEETWQPGEYLSRKSGRMEWRDSVDSPEPPPPDGSLAGWAAIYAAYVEENTDFIYDALQTVAARNRGVTA